MNYFTTANDPRSCLYWWLLLNFTCVRINWRNTEETGMQTAKARWANITPQDAITLLACLLPDLATVAKLHGLDSIAVNLDKANSQVRSIKKR
jgi:hypothetical protein